MVIYVFEVMFDNGHTDTFTATAKNDERAIELLRSEVDFCVTGAKMVSYNIVGKFDIS